MDHKLLLHDLEKIVTDLHDQIGKLPPDLTETFQQIRNYILDKAHE